MQTFNHKQKEAREAALSAECRVSVLSAECCVLSAVLLCADGPYLCSALAYSSTRHFFPSSRFPRRPASIRGPLPLPTPPSSRLLLKPLRHAPSSLRRAPGVRMLPE